MHSCEKCKERINSGVLEDDIIMCFRCYHKYLRIRWYKMKTIKCSICKDKIFESNSHNAYPINEGRCCDICNFSVVIPMRLKVSRSKDG